MWGFLAGFSGKYLISGLIISVVGLLLVSHGWTYRHGVKFAQQECTVEKAEALLKFAEESERIRLEDIEIALAGVQREKEIEVVVRTIRVDVPTPECRDLGDDWLREANRALSAAGARASTPSVPASGSTGWLDP
jgi:hypothetical protein